MRWGRDSGVGESRMVKIQYVVEGVLAVAVLVFLVINALVGGGGEKAPEAPVEEVPVPVVSRVSGRMLLTGNVFWGRNVNKAARASEMGPPHAFSRLGELSRENYTDWIGGLECPVTEKGGVHSEYEEMTLLQFNCDPDYLPEFAKWFSVVSLGNNHMDNQGVEGFTETKEQLAGAGVQYFGHYDYRDTEEVCAVVAVGVWEEMSDGTRREGKLPMAFCGHHGVFGVPTEAAMAQIAAYAEVMPVVAMPHMGVEYEAENDELRQNVYRKMIDYGAELVAGDHPHWVQNAEAYRGRLIVYSMGNFMFDQYWNEEVRRSAAIDAGFLVSGAEGWGEIAEECASGGLAVCRGLAEEAGLAKYSVGWEYGVVGTESTDFVAGVASEGVQMRILQRLGWGEVVGLLGRG